MPSINLIAEKRQWKRDRIRKARTWFLAFIVVACLALITVGILTLHHDRLKADLQELEAQATILHPIKKDIENTQKSLLELTPRLKTLTEARKDTERWSRILDHVARVVPVDTWLTRFDSLQPTDPTQPVEITWTGMSVRQELVGEFMLMLQRSQDLGNIELKYTDLRRTAQGVGLEFQIFCKVPGTEVVSPTVAKQTNKEVLEG
ncbi:MAG: PilN domain-containing protein [Candidatus Caldarchaeum sp.]